MSDELFNIPPTDSFDARLNSARRRYSAAQVAYDEADADPDGKLLKEMLSARGELNKLELEANAKARGINDRRLY